MKPGNWPALIFRVFGVGNLLLAGVAACLTLLAVGGLAMSTLRNTPDAPYFLQVFATMTAINLTFEIMLAIAGVRLWQKRPEGVAICNVLFPVEVLYFLGVTVLSFPAFPKTSTMSLAGATGIGNVSLVVQWITGYPIVALVVLNLVRRRLNATFAAAPPLVAQG
ncbi:MAG: hypothetical protein WB995_00725 [Candidatus Acidiferrales bacterium]